MSNHADDENAVPAETTRRSLFRKSAEVAVTAPAVALLLSATAKKAHATSPYQVDTNATNSVADASDLPTGGLVSQDDGFSDDLYPANFDRT